MSKYFHDIDESILQSIILGDAGKVLHDVGVRESKLTVQEQQMEMQKPTLLALAKISEAIQEGNDEVVQAVSGNNIEEGNLIDGDAPMIDIEPLVPDAELMGIDVQPPVDEMRDIAQARDSAKKAISKAMSKHDSVYRKTGDHILLGKSTLARVPASVIQTEVKRLGIPTRHLKTKSSMIEALHQHVGAEAMDMREADALSMQLPESPMPVSIAEPPRRKLLFKKKAPVAEAMELTEDALQQRMGEIMGKGLTKKFQNRLNDAFVNGEIDESDLYDLLRTEKIRVRRKKRVNKKEELYKIAKQLGYDKSYIRATARSLREFIQTGALSNKSAHNDMIAVDSDQENDDDNQVRLSDLAHELKTKSINPMRHMDRIEEILQIFVEQGVMTVKQANEYIRGL